MKRTYRDNRRAVVEIVHEFIRRVEVDEAVYTPKKYSHWARGKTQKIGIINNYIDDVSESLKDG